METTVLAVPEKASAARAGLWQGLALAVAIALVYWRIVAALCGDWVHDPNYSHGFFVPLFCAWVVWRERERLKSIPSRPSNGGLLVILGPGRLDARRLRRGTLSFAHIPALPDRGAGHIYARVAPVSGATLSLGSAFPDGAAARDCVQSDCLPAAVSSVAISKRPAGPRRRAGAARREYHSIAFAHARRSRGVQRNSIARFADHTGRLLRIYLRAAENPAHGSGDCGGSDCRGRQRRADHGQRSAGPVLESG